MTDQNPQKSDTSPHGTKDSDEDIFDELDELENNDVEHDADDVLDRFGRSGRIDRPQADILECVGCGAGWVHQFKIEAFFRDEDSDTGVRVDAAADGASFDENMDGCPSARRSGLSIWFWCEQCEAVTRMDVVQHKGETFVHTGVDGMITREEVEAL